jgi:hypothetical protein
VNRQVLCIYTAYLICLAHGFEMDIDRYEYLIMKSDHSKFEIKARQKLVFNGHQIELIMVFRKLWYLVLREVKHFVLIDAVISTFV